jgi:hypothetical protein
MNETYHYASFFLCSTPTLSYTFIAKVASHPGLQYVFQVLALKVPSFKKPLRSSYLETVALLQTLTLFTDLFSCDVFTFCYYNNNLKS